MSPLVAPSAKSDSQNNYSDFDMVLFRLQSVAHALFLRPTLLSHLVQSELSDLLSNYRALDDNIFELSPEIFSKMTPKDQELLEEDAKNKIAEREKMQEAMRKFLFSHHLDTLSVPAELTAKNPAFALQECIQKQVAHTIIIETL